LGRSFEKDGGKNALAAGAQDGKPVSENGNAFALSTIDKIIETVIIAYCASMRLRGGSR
jgi:hypothetical protein